MFSIDIYAHVFKWFLNESLIKNTTIINAYVYLFNHKNNIP